MEKSTTIPKAGEKSLKDRIADGIKWKEEKLAAGWQDTPDGYMPMTEVKRAGYVLNEAQEWTIPAEEYIADGNYDRPAGEKYWGVSRQYLQWRQNKKTNGSNRVATPKQFNFKKEEERETAPVFKNDNEIRVEDIPF